MRYQLRSVDESAISALDARVHPRRASRTDAWEAITRGENEAEQKVFDGACRLLSHALTLTRALLLLLTDSIPDR